MNYNHMSKGLLLPPLNDYDDLSHCWVRNLAEKARGQPLHCTSPSLVALPSLARISVYLAEDSTGESVRCQLHSKIRGPFFTLSSLEDYRIVVSTSKIPHHQTRERPGNKHASLTRRRGCEARTK